MTCLAPPSTLAIDVVPGQAATSQERWLVALGSSSLFRCPLCWLLGKSCRVWAFYECYGRHTESNGVKRKMGLLWSCSFSNIHKRQDRGNYNCSLPSYEVVVCTSFDYISLFHSLKFKYISGTHSPGPNIPAVALSTPPGVTESVI